jgi:predicted ATPase/DNA-binding SARP family transcriptional activator
MSSSPSLPLSPVGLPVPLTRFIGRAQELEDLVRLLPTTRLVTLTGPGGTGKSRLAREVAASSQSRFEAVAWVDFAPVTDPALVPRQLMIALRVGERAGESVVDQLMAAIGSHRVLVVLDNCDHLLDPCAQLIETLLLGCPGLGAIATSREALGVQGETAWLVPPLEITESMQLFVERAQAAQPTFALNPSNYAAVRDICKRLDGIPLAIELAAARIKVLSPEQIAERLSDAFKLLVAGSRTALPRHRTLRGTMDWSYQLLSDREQILFRQLAVFSGSFTLDAAEAICGGDGIGSDDVLESVTMLVDKSLVSLGSRDGEARYRLLEVVRQYGHELLSTEERAELREKHAVFYLALAEMAAPKLFGGAADPALVARLSAETGNFRAVAEWALEDPLRMEMSLRLGTALHWFWFARGRFEEGRDRLTHAIGIASHAAPGVRGWALIALGHVHLWQGNPVAALPRMQEALVLLQDVDDPEGLAYALNGVGAAIALSGDPVRCVQYLEAAIPIAETLENRVLLAIILYYHGRAAQDRGELAQARASFERATSIGRATRNRPTIAHPLSMEGKLAAVEGRIKDAAMALGESLEIHHSIDDAWGVMQTLEGLAQVAASRKRFRDAAHLLAASEAMREKMQTPHFPTEKPAHDALTASVRAGLGEGATEAWTEGVALGRPAAVKIGLAVATSALKGGTTTASTPAVQRPVAPVPELVVRTLGPLEVIKQGTPIPGTAWGSARPRELLVMLLVNPDGLTKEQVGLAFWPEASTAQVRNSFHVTLHRLRRALGHPEWIETAGERYRLAPSLPWELDARVFEKAVTTALKRKDLPALARTLEMYRGDFLDGEGAGDWHFTMRDRLQRLYVDGLSALATAQAAAGQHEEVAATSRKLLARDPLHEESWRRLMKSHARQGERNQALKLYQQLTELLARELDAEPDPETADLADAIGRGAL